MAISKVNISRVPNGGRMRLKCTLLSGTRHNESMENLVVSKVATISDYDNDIDKPISKQTGINRIWPSLTVITRNPSTSETTDSNPEIH